MLALFENLVGRFYPTFSDPGPGPINQQMFDYADAYPTTFETFVSMLQEHFSKEDVDAVAAGMRAQKRSPAPPHAVERAHLR